MTLVLALTPPEYIMEGIAVTINNWLLKLRSQRSSKKLLASVFLFSIVLLSPCTRLSAQVANGINGTVTDESGAVIAGAKV